MTRRMMAGVALGGLLALLAIAGLQRTPDLALEPTSATVSTVAPTTVTDYEGLLFGRITTDDGESYQGRLRWGGDEEALWSNYFNGFKGENPWVAHVSKEQRPTKHRSIGVFGFEVFGWERELDLGRPFMARFGDIASIEPRGRRFRVTLKSGSVFELDRFEADDLADGVRVWDENRGVVDIGEWQIRLIELLPTPRLEEAPYPLQGTVRTRQGDFTGLIQWDREACLTSDELSGYGAEGELRVPFDNIRSISRRSRDSSLVTLRDGSEIVLSGTREVGDGHRGIYVDDERYGRVLVSWDTFARIDFTEGGAGLAYADYATGGPLRGGVITRSGQRLAGRLVYDLDESETTETLDAPSRGVDYTIPFSLIASIELPRRSESSARFARVVLHTGEELDLERSGDLGDENAGMLVFVDGRQDPVYVPWTDIERVQLERVDLDRLPAM